MFKSYPCKRKPIKPTFTVFLLAFCERVCPCSILKNSYEPQYCSYSLGSSGHSLKIIEICLEGLDNIQRVDDFSEVKKTIQEIQQYLVMKRSLGMYECVYADTEK